MWFDLGVGVWEFYFEGVLCGWVVTMGDGGYRVYSACCFFGVCFRWWCVLVGLSPGVFLGGYGVLSICGTICILFRPYLASCGMTFNIICRFKLKKNSRRGTTGKHVWARAKIAGGKQKSIPNYVEKYWLQDSVQAFFPSMTFNSHRCSISSNVLWVQRQKQGSRVMVSFSLKNSEDMQV